MSAARQPRRVFLAGQAEVFEKAAGSMQIRARRKACGDIGKRAGKARKVRLLGEILQSRPRLQEAGAGGLLDASGGDAQKGGFARAVAADEADALTGRNRQFRALEEGRAAECEADIAQLKKRGCHARDIKPVEAEAARWVFAAQDLLGSYCHAT
jgi:hypothetical protein